MDYLSSNKTVYSAKYLIIWCPKHPKRVLVGPFEARLMEITAGVLDELGGQRMEVKVLFDHAHMRAEVPPQIPLSRLVQLFRGRSSRLLRRRYPSRRGARRRAAPWSPWWFGSTVGEARRDALRRSVKNQLQVA